MLNCAIFLVQFGSIAKLGCHIHEADMPYHPSSKLVGGTLRVHSSFTAYPPVPIIGKERRVEGEKEEKRVAV